MQIEGPIVTLLKIMIEVVCSIKMGFKIIKRQATMRNGYALPIDLFKFIFSRDVSQGLLTGSRIRMFFKSRENHIWCFYAEESSLKLSYLKKTNWKLLSGN